VEVKDISVTGCEDALLKVANVTGLGIEPALKIDAPADPALVAEASEAYHLG
jgi:hypothetical protein